MKQQEFSISLVEWGRVIIIIDIEIRKLWNEKVSSTNIQYSWKASKVLSLYLSHSLYLYFSFSSGFLFWCRILIFFIVPFKNAESEIGALTVNIFYFMYF